MTCEHSIISGQECLDYCYFLGENAWKRAVFDALLWRLPEFNSSPWGLALGRLVKDGAIGAWRNERHERCYQFNGQQERP